MQTNAETKKPKKPEATREVTKISPRFYTDNLEECKTYALNKKYGGEYQTFLKDLIDEALKDKNLLKRMGVL